MSLQITRDNWAEKFEIITDENITQKIQDRVSCRACCVCNKCVDVKKILWQNGLYYCWQCFEESFSQKCFFCRRFIRGSNEMEFVYYNNKVWHKECFSQNEITL